MTDALPPPDDLELLAAAVLDGETDEALLARLDRDPELRDRVDAQERARRALRSPVAPLPAAEVDAMVARALEAAPDVPTATPDATSRHDDRSTGPARIPDRRAQRRRDGFGAGGRTAVPWLVAAAVVLVLAIAAVAVPVSRSGRSSDSASSPVSGDVSSSAGGSDASSGPSAPATGRAEAAVGTDLGTGTAEELATTALDRATGGSASTPYDVVPAAPTGPATAGEDLATDSANGLAPGPLECASSLFPGAPVLFVGTGRVDGAPVGVVVVGSSPGTAGAPTAAVVGPGCTLLARRAG